MRALSIRQPFAELILRGIKTAEFRSRPTRIIAERFYIYAGKGAGKVWSSDLAVGADLPGWMVELAEQVGMIQPELADGLELPTGVIVGSAVIRDCSPVRNVGGDGEDFYAWHLAEDASPANKSDAVLLPTGS